MSLCDLTLGALYHASLGPRHLPRNCDYICPHSPVQAIDQTQFSILPDRPPELTKMEGLLWAIYLLNFLLVLDGAMINVALPTITTEIGGLTQYVWIADAFLVAASVLQPLYMQLPNVFGRRYLLVSLAILTILGSAIAGAAKKAAELIAGRTVQGVGVGGINVLWFMPIGNPDPSPRHKNHSQSPSFLAVLAMILGPIIGGALARGNWRWIFYLNIPIGAVVLIVLIILPTLPETTPDETPIKRPDYLGALLLIPSTISLLLGLTRNGVDQPWSSWRTIVPLVLGPVGWIVFLLQQRLASNPGLPPRLFVSLTSVILHLLTFLGSILDQALFAFLPIYFQAARGTTAIRSGICLLPLTTMTVFVGFPVLICWLFFAWFDALGAHRPLQAIAFALSTLSFGLLTHLNETSSTVEWVFIQLIAGAGMGMRLISFPIMVAVTLPTADCAAGLAVNNFIYSFGRIWGMTIASLVFDAVVGGNLGEVRDLEIRGHLTKGGAYAFASQMHGIKGTLEQEVWGEVVGVYVKGLRMIWWVGLGISCFACLAVWLGKAYGIAGVWDHPDAPDAPDAPAAPIVPVTRPAKVALVGSKKLGEQEERWIGMVRH
ncbi:MFS general substrate transporter [Aspergillus sclerotiicarbonarius CBS 121057]|uniref:MFS general substrate transporter n=1 Tax=Aspergillus sclerotiicarbonarius (strain CBS 121057 / IBT 28362) TaxID=1448318 RepID=A0A319ES80_ASPSB|nr:MFS general substrate transporter [Aspergillus sclerotiicarbonarius CBS 121057]